MANATFLTANETFLGLDSWINGSLTPQLAGRPAYLTPYDTNPESQGLNLTVYPNNLAGLSFLIHDDTIPLTFPLAQAIFDTNSFRVAIECTFPLSGQYDDLPRALFYVLLVVSVLFRRHNWLATAALGTAMIYSATTAIHLFALMMLFKFGNPKDPNGWNKDSSKAYGDVDVYAIYPILSAAGIALTPILNWSGSVRASNSRIVVAYWGFLIFAALVPAWLYNYWLDWYVDGLPSFALCPYPAPDSQSECRPGIDLDDVTYFQCQCIDFCGTLSPTTPLRARANMVAWLLRPVSERAFGSQNTTFAKFLSFNTFVVIFIFIHGVLGLIEGEFTQAEIRNIIFRVFLTQPRDIKNFSFEGLGMIERLRRPSMYRASTNAPLRWRIQFHVARIGAASFYVVAILMAIICPAVFITNIIANEVSIGYFPTSEQSDAAGAWNPWVGAALVLIAALIIPFHSTWFRFFHSSIAAIWRFFTCKLRRNRSQNQGPQPEANRPKFDVFSESAMSPIHHGWHSTKLDYCKASFALQSFVRWWKDPIHRSRQTRLEAEQDLQEALDRIPPCRCSICRSYRANRIEVDMSELENYTSIQLQHTGKTKDSELPPSLKRRASA